MSFAEKLAALKAEVEASPTPSSWHRCCVILDAIRSRSNRLVAVDYLLERIDQWPLAQRRALKAWRRSHQKSEALPAGIDKLELDFEAAPLLTEAEIVAAAPDAKVLKAARALARADKWIQLGQDRRCSWGWVQGSRDEYAVYAEADYLLLDCGCPSRKRPCKHAIALLLCPLQGVDVPEAPLPPGHRDQATFYDSSFE